MNSQIFKNQISKDILFDLLDKICIKNEKYYTLSKISYKKGEYMNIISPFNELMLPNYHKSKQFYITRKQNYSSFVTVVRQLCRLNSISYTSKIVYNKSTYDIVYYIYFKGLELFTNPKNEGVSHSLDYEIPIV